MTKRILLWMAFCGMIILLIIAYMSKNPLNDFISENMKDLMGDKSVVSVEELIDLKYNYTKNDLDYEFSILEFGSTGCTICKQMETELEKIRKWKPGKINVIFLNTNYPENNNFVKYFGISAIPMQVMLDKNGIEFFKNYGFISADDMIKKTTEHSLKQY
jgi:thiol-disulfide isomerase/thioredoxin